MITDDRAVRNGSAHLAPEGLEELTIVIPARNAEGLLDECLGSIMRTGAAEVLVIDGMSTDDTVNKARTLGARVLSDEGRGLPYARALGAEVARTRYVALVDADVVIPDGALRALFDEFREGGYTALQAGLESTGGPGYWGRALAHHHRTGRSRNWFGVVATIFERRTLLEYGFDDRFLSGEDIDLRWRLQKSGARIGVSERTHVVHRFDDHFAFALDQWLADGRGLARMSSHGLKGRVLLALPFAAGLRGIALSLVRREPIWVPYFALFTLFNYVGIASHVRGRRRR